MELLITDVTEMGAGNFCVAGWSYAENRMIRPLPNGANWVASLVQQHGIQPGQFISVTPTGFGHNGSYPHSSEDLPILRDSIAQIAGNAPQWIGAGAPPALARAQQVFGENIAWNSEFQGRKQGVYVPTGTQCPSLGGLASHTHRFRLVEDFGKLKAIFEDDDSEYIVSVSARYLKEAFRNGGIDNASGLLPDNSPLHVRLGLAREWAANPGKCFLMVNGVYW